ncbi:hypothetical protein [Peribacillus simplex]|uniref:Uncharacterized protein n=1 Tax=Peribacillus simplex TaxID=1478 RepID=A0AAN2PCN7_9BACI|nr:hypothetical protein [Peribacillus simplex]CEG30033.1 hypothetical protein BN1180_00128 [Peribacillus simplex]
MRKDDIYEILQEVDETLLLIGEQYVKAHEDKEIQEVVKVKVKNALENFRSCLDYCLHDIDELVLNRNRKVIYFPYESSKNAFKTAIHKNFKGLRNKNSKVYDALESVQDFNNPDSPWLTILCRRTNKVKHDKLLKQSRRDNHQVTIPGLGKFKNNRNVVFENCTMVTDTAVIPIDFSIDHQGNITSNKPIDPRLSIEKIDWVTFTIANTNRDVLEFLTQCRNEIGRMVEQIYLEIG